MRVIVVVIASVAIVGLGCGPQLEPLGTGDASTTANGSSTSTSGLPPETSPATTTTTDPGTTTAAADSTSTDDGFDGSSDTGCSFTCPPPVPPPPDGGTCNCPPGDKCMPWSNDGSDTWTAIRCSPIAENAGQPGDPCTVEGSQWSGIDDCDDGVMCFGVDPKTNEGYCTPFCSWLGDGPCPDGTECEVQEGSLGFPLCVPSCDPTVPSCPDGTACFPGGSSFTCQPTVPMRMPIGAACAEPGSCVAGALCSFVVDCGQPPGEGCCVEVCVVGDPNPCPGPATCVPWFGGAGGPEWSHVGYCV